MPLREYVAAVLRDSAKNYETPVDFVQHVSYFFGPRKLNDGEIMNSDREGRMCIMAAMRLEEVPANRWLCGVLSDKIRLIVQVLLDISTKDSVAHSSNEPEVERKEWRKRFNLHLRKLVTGGLPGPGLSETMHLLGRHTVLSRISEWADYFVHASRGSEQQSLLQLLPQHRQKPSEGLDDTSSEVEDRGQPSSTT